MARWIFGITTLVVPVLFFGAFEGLYNHVAKDAFYFAGVSMEWMLRLFPPPTYEMPNDVLFEITGVLQAAPAGLTAWQLYRWVYPPRVMG
ncbi:hypothetical protein LZC95_04470 [Pendulispora brunnea]|uniref:Uncharacterized protein n=1 Tax=Pendulispora brunnea TaxID=2905690 RepID=A0ABZ2KBQ4_9BACT